MQRIEVTQFKIPQRDGADPEITVTRRRLLPMQRIKRVTIFRYATLDKPEHENAKPTTSEQNLIWPIY
jgi:hypothetical protein